MYIKLNEIPEVKSIVYNIVEELPNVSIPANISREALNTLGYDILYIGSIPEYDKTSCKLILSNIPTYSTLNSRWELVYNVHSMTDTELLEIYNSEAYLVNTKRLELLAKSDWTQLTDSPVDQQAWAIYRQALRDIPIQQGFPFSISWPSAPE